MKKVVAIIQARQGATRLPGKVMKEVLSKPLLGYLIDRVRRAKTLNEIVVATTSQDNDQVIEAFCNKNSIECYRGDPENVLSRYYEIAVKYSADVIVRITGDCPLIDPGIIDKVVSHFLEGSSDYVSNTLKRTYPRGMDVEVFSFKALKLAAESSAKNSEREHVTAFMYTHPDLFKMENVENETDESLYRWTVDTAEDFELIKKMIEALYPSNHLFTYHDLLRSMEENPDWIKINAHVEQKKVT